mmetsp:Transcript_20736/g.65031  ORF Transcript_20736/g.65031 Transcript_20736/m.65031 type:complete len:219 (+) Transcript_20736:73-729(+)
MARAVKDPPLLACRSATRFRTSRRARLLLGREALPSPPESCLRRVTRGWTESTGCGSRCSARCSVNIGAGGDGCSRREAMSCGSVRTGDLGVSGSASSASRAPGSPSSLSSARTLRLSASARSEPESSPGASPPNSSAPVAFSLSMSCHCTPTKSSSPTLERACRTTSSVPSVGLPSSAACSSPSAPMGTMDSIAEFKRSLCTFTKPVSSRKAARVRP